MENLKVLILAAGKGTRMKSSRAKVLHMAGGRPLLASVLTAAKAVAGNVTIVIGHQADTVRSLFPEEKFVEQKQQLGTGHAVLSAKDEFAAYRGDILVLPGDVPLITPATLESFIRFHREGNFRASVLTAEVPDPKGYGRIVRSAAHQVGAIIEDRDANEDVQKIREINSSIYIFDSTILFEALSGIGNRNAQSEYYLTDVIAIMSGKGLPVGACKMSVPDEVLGINDRKELAAVDRLMRQRKRDSLMKSGVTIVDPDSTFIDADVQIGPDTVIYPSVQILGVCEIGEDVTIHSFSRISNARIGAGSTILESCVIADSELGRNVSVGPYAHLRAGTALGNEVSIGNFVEIKKSTLGESTKSRHLAYLGDATIGKRVNIGAGVITCNYDGVAKHPTVIEDDVFVGTDSQLIAPVTLGKGSYVGAGSSITTDVPPESLAIARARQVIKEGRMKDRKKK
jgi:bifunctional UDP-N-acetylglucosamine pyrophosphorylase/glucosamine-1-phosphate N-acetyltransferase